MGDKKGIILGIFVLVFSLSGVLAWADNTSLYQEVDGCNLLNTTGANYVLTGNVSSTGNCFSISAQNITLDCNGNWITYSTGGAGNTYGINTTQFNTTIKNCNVLDGNWASAQTTRYGIYFNTNDYSTLFNNFVNTNKSLAVYLYNNANYNNLTLNTIMSNATTALALSSGSNNILDSLNLISDNTYGIYLDSSTNNTLINVNATSNTNYGLFLQYISNTTLINVNANSIVTKKDLYFMPNSVYDCNNTFTNVNGGENKPIKYIKGTYSNLSDVDGSLLILCDSNFSNVTNSNFTRGGARLFYSYYNSLSEIIGHSDTEKTFYLYSSSKNNSLTDIISSSSTNYAISLEGSNNTLFNINSTSSTNYGLIISMGSGNNLTNVNATSSTQFGLYLLSTSNNTLDNVNISSNSSYGLRIFMGSGNILNRLNVFSNLNYAIDLRSSSQNTLSNSNITSNNNYGIIVYDSTNNNISNSTIISNLNDSINIDSSSKFNILSNNKFISTDNTHNLVILSANSGFNKFYWNNFTETSGYYVQDLNGSNYYNTTIAGRGEGNIWNDIMNGSVNITGNVYSTLNPSLYIGEYGTGYPYNSTNSFGKVSGNVVDYAPLTNNLTPITCSVLYDVGRTYTLTQNVSSTGTCFNITAQNITLDCNENWITYSTGGAAETFGIYTNQLNTTIKNCNVLDGNWTSSQTTRYGIYFNGNDNSTLFNNLVNTSSSHDIYLENNANYNNLTYLNTSSNTGKSLSLNSSSNNYINQINAIEGIEVYYSNNSVFSNINIINNNLVGIESTLDDGISLMSSSYNNLSNIDIIINSNDGMYLDYGIYISGGSNHKLSNIDVISNDNALGIVFYETLDNTLINSSIESDSQIALQLGWGLGSNLISDVYTSSNLSSGFDLRYSSGNWLYNLTVVSKESFPFYLMVSNSNIIANSTFISLDKTSTLIDIVSCSSNTFYGNNFTETSGYYVQDLNGSNYYNTTIAGRGEGNIWNDIMNGSVDITGNVSSTLNPSLYIGKYGADYPYNNTNSFGKISGNVVDYAPLTNQFKDSLSPTYSSVAHNSTYANKPTKFAVRINDETALETNGQYIFSTNNTGQWVNDTAINFTSTPSWANVTKTLNSTVGMVVGYRWYFNDNEGNMNSTSVYVLTTTSVPEVPVTPPSSSGGGSTTQTQTQYQLGREFSEQGESLKLKKNYQVGFKHGEESHTLTLNSFTVSTAKVTIQSDPIIATLEKDITQSFNIDGEEGTDFEITYQGTSGSEAQFFIKKVVEVTGESEVFANAEGGEVQETTTNQISTDELFGTSGSGSESVDAPREKTKRAKNPFRTVLIGLIIMGAIIGGLYAIGKNEKKKKEHYLGFFDK